MWCRSVRIIFEGITPQLSRPSPGHHGSKVEFYTSWSIMDQLHIMILTLCLDYVFLVDDVGQWNSDYMNQFGEISLNILQYCLKSLCAVLSSVKYKISVPAMLLK